MDLLIDSTARHIMFSFMDGFSGYYQIRMTPRDVKKTDFGLKNAGATYQCTMTAIFHDMMHHEKEDYVDDIVIKSRNYEDYVRVLRKVFNLCRLFKLKMNPLKYALGVSRVPSP